MIHHIRRSILDKLAMAEDMRYGEIKPDDLDGNVFNYHLKGLIADGYVQKGQAGAYALAQLGRDYIVHRFEDPTESAHSIFLIVLKNGSSEYLLRRRDTQPLLGYTGFLHGEPEAGVSVLHTAAKRLQDKTGIKDVELSVVGSSMITQYSGGELQSFSQALIIYGQTDQDIAIENDATGYNYWAEVNAVETVLPSCADIIQMIEDKQAWLERTYELLGSEK